VKVCFADDPNMKELIDDTEDEVIEAIMASKRPWKWHGKAYVGAVHGAIGIITQIVLTDASWAPDLEAELGALLSYQYDSGNWPSSIPPGRDRLVQVCHGAPGVVISLLSIKKYFPKLEAKIDSAIVKARECIQERGLLTKEACLCHGISGNALAMEDQDCAHFLSFSKYGSHSILRIRCFMSGDEINASQGEFMQLLTLHVYSYGTRNEKP
jgi:lantibiotic modifying enzyme